MGESRVYLERHGCVERRTDPKNESDVVLLAEDPFGRQGATNFRETEASGCSVNKELKEDRGHALRPSS